MHGPPWSRTSRNVQLSCLSSALFHILRCSNRRPIAFLHSSGVIATPPSLTGKVCSTGGPAAWSRVKVSQPGSRPRTTQALGPALKSTGETLEGNKTTVYIEAHEGRQFRVLWRDDRPVGRHTRPTGMYGQLFVDGIRATASSIQSKEQGRVRTMDHLRLTADYCAPFLFAKVSRTPQSG